MDQEIAIIGNMLSLTNEEAIILCRADLPDDNFITEIMTATFGHISYIDYIGEPYFETTLECLHDDQFILRLSNLKIESYSY